jgi:hypothetical protein
MSKRPGDAISEEARALRGFNPNLPPPDDSLPEPEDPRGEEAYQRAFHKSAKMKPPRVPNPLAYPNSPSAQAYLKNRSLQYGQPSTTRIPNSTYFPPPPDDHSLRRAQREHERQRHLDEADSARSSPSIRQDSSSNGALQSQIRAPPQAFPPLPLPPPLPLQQQHYGQPSFTSPRDPLQQQPPPEHLHRGPSTMEPQMQAPSGPRNPFR